jgi:hypothetical protein
MLFINPFDAGQSSVGSSEDLLIRELDLLGM